MGFLLILNNNKLNKIKLCCSYKEVDVKLTNVTMVYVFKNGSINKEIVIDNLNKNDDKELYMRILSIVYNLYHETFYNAEMC